jgi:hypothetical protein
MRTKAPTVNRTIARWDIAFSFAWNARGNWNGMTPQADCMSNVKQARREGWSKLLILEL